MVNASHKQPRGFSIFFLTEMWERYGFYVIQTLLVFYLTNKLHLGDSQTYVIIGSFTALAYINSIFGGLISDRLTNYNSALVSGGILLFIGYVVVGLADNMRILTVGLSMVTVGTGLLKPNVSGMLSILYPNNDSRKDSGYTLYYVGIYVGALSGSLIGGYIQKYFGWSTVFFSSAVGMIFAVVIFLYGRAKFKLVDPRRPVVPFVNHIKALIAILVLISVSAVVLHSEHLSLMYFFVIGIFCLGFILYCIITHHGEQRNRLIAFLFLVLLAVLYWAIYFQQFFSISLCTERACQLSVPASSIPSVESLGIIIFGPIINAVWFYLRDKNKDLSIPAKFSLSFLFNSLCFLLLTGSLWYSAKAGIYLSVWFIAGAYLLVAIGELCISPTSLSMVTTLVPQRLTGAMMGISLLSIGFGGKLAGLLASNAALSQKRNSLLEIQTVYMNSFMIYFWISLATFIAAIILTKYIRKLINN